MGSIRRRFLKLRKLNLFKFSFNIHSSQDFWAKCKFCKSAFILSGVVEYAKEQRNLFIINVIAKKRNWCYLSFDLCFLPLPPHSLIQLGTLVYIIQAPLLHNSSLITDSSGILDVLRWSWCILALFSSNLHQVLHVPDNFLFKAPIYQTALIIAHSVISRLWSGWNINEN